MEQTGLDGICVRIADLAKDYSEEVKVEAVEELRRTAGKVLDYVRENCPKSGYGANHLADSFETTEVGEGLGTVIYISSKSKGRLVHLVELGFRHRSGKHVAARPFLRPAYDSFAPEMLEHIRRIIKGGRE